jgi:hypothetical protein
MAVAAVQVVDAREDGVVIEVSVRPRSGRCRVAGLVAGRIRIEVTAAPEDGEATRQALATLAGALGVKTSQASLLRGARERHKTIHVQGVTLDTCCNRLGLDPIPSPQ